MLRRIVFCLALLSLTAGLPVESYIEPCRPVSIPVTGGGAYISRYAFHSFPGRSLVDLSSATAYGFAPGPQQPLTVRVDASGSTVAAYCGGEYSPLGYAEIILRR
jgi:hypothetical protein